MATSSLTILAEDVISQVLYFTPCIWDVLHFTATSRRFHSVAEEHLKTLTYLYIRLPFQPGSPQAEPIKEGIKTLVKDRLSTRLTVVDILNPRYWLRELDLWTRLQLVSERVKHIICKNTDSALYDLMCLIAIDGTTIKKHHRRHLQLNGKLINDLVRLIDSNEKHPFEVAEMLSSVETLDIHLDGLGAVSYVDWTTLFPNLKVLGLGFRFFGDTLSPEIAPTLIRTIGDMKEEGKLKLNYFEFLTNPALASLLQGYLSRLCIDWNVEYRGFPPPFDLSSYEKLEAKISGFLEDTETFLSAICRSKQITFYYSDLEKAMRLIWYRSHDTVKLNIDLRSITAFEAGQLFQCIVYNCPNLRHLEMNVIGQFDFEIICFIKKVGSLLRVIKLSYDRLVPNDVVSAIVTHCSNAEKLELEGAAYDVESVKSLCPSFRRMPNLGLVLFRNWSGCGTADPVTLVYCNNKMALEGYHFPGGKSLHLDSDWKLSAKWRQDI